MMLHVILFIVLCLNIGNGNPTTLWNGYTKTPVIDTLHVSRTQYLLSKTTYSGTNTKTTNKTGQVTSSVSTTLSPDIKLSGVNSFLDVSETSDSEFGDENISDTPRRHTSALKRQTCCSKLPSICNTEGQCILDMTVCVKLCLCVTGIRNSWCQQMLSSLTRQASERDMPESIELSLAVVSHSINTTAHPPTNHTAMLESDFALNSTGFRHSAITTDHIFRVPESNNMSHLSTGEVLLQTQVNATALTQEYRLTKQTHSGERELKHTSDTMNPTTSRAPFTGVTSDPSSEEFLVESQFVTASTKTNISFSDLLDKNSASKIDSLLPLLVTAMPNEITLPPVSSFDDDNTLDKPHPCDDCPGVCRLDFVSYELVCDRTEVDKCENFDCGDHGTCVVSNITNLVSCLCDDTHTGTFCEHVCDLDCGDFGDCNYINNTAVCVCHWNTTGEFCETFRTTEAPEVRALASYTVISPPWYLLGIGLVLLFVLMVICVVFPYWTWRRRWLPMRKLVHYFQAYEDDDGKLYDAFVSYKSSKQDEYFVIHKLYPKLEKELDFKLCLHFRDFPPGEAIADNIIHAIENSRRTILIISPNFVESEWCRLEYQKAQQEMLKLKHKIIPIMLQDISGLVNVDKNLKQIMNTVTFIEWPKNEETESVHKFWQLMQCSMPKKKPDSSRSESSLGSCSSQKPLRPVTQSISLDTLSDDVFTTNDVTSSSEETLPPDDHSLEGGNCAAKSNDVDAGFSVDVHSEPVNYFVENESTKTKWTTAKQTAANEPLTVNSNSFFPVVNTALGSRDENLIHIQRLPGNKLKIYKVYSADSPDVIDSHC